MGIKLFLLQEDGRYRIKNAELDSEFPTLIRSKKLKRAFTMRMRPVVPHIKPKKLLEWDELNSHEPVTHLSYRNSAMLVYESEFYPVAYGGGVPDKATDEDEALRVAEVGSLVAATRASKRDLGGGIASLAYLSLVAAIVIMVILWSFMFTPTILERFNNDSDEPPVAQRGPL